MSERMQPNWNAHTLLVGNKMVLLEKIYQFFVLFSYKSQHNLLSTPLPGIYPREMTAYAHKETSRMFKAVLFTIVKDLNNQNVHQQEIHKQLWFIYTMDWHSAIIMNEPFSNTGNFIDESHTHYSEWKSGTKRIYAVWFHFYDILEEVKLN